MSKFEISIIKDEEFIEDIIRYEDIWDVYGSLNISINGKMLGFLDNLAFFLSYFYNSCLASLPEIYLGKVFKFKSEASYELVFEPKDDNVTIYLVEENKRHDDEIDIPFKDFADEVIRSVDEYVDYILDMRPDLRETERTIKFKNEVDELKNLYAQCCEKNAT